MWWQSIKTLSVNQEVGPSPDIKCADALILHFQPPELWAINLCYLEAIPSMFFVVVVLATLCNTVFFMRFYYLHRVLDRAQNKKPRPLRPNGHVIPHTCPPSFLLTNGLENSLIWRLGRCMGSSTTINNVYFQIFYLCWNLFLLH